MAVLSRRQAFARRRIEQGIRLAAPALDLLLFAGHHASRFAGRNDPVPEPPRRAARSGERSRLGLSGTRPGG